MAKRAHPRPVTIAVPASIANLGPGLDTLALAVTLFCACACGGPEA